MLGYLEGKPELRGENITFENSEIIEPCYIGSNGVEERENWSKRKLG